MSVRGVASPPAAGTVHICEPGSNPRRGCRAETKASTAPDGTELRVRVEGEDLTTGEMVSKTVLLPLGPAGRGAARLAEHAGLEVREEDGKILIDNIVFGSPAEQAKLDFDWEITVVELPASRLPKEVYVPAAVLLLLIYFLQRRRRSGGASLVTAGASV